MPTGMVHDWTEDWLGTSAVALHCQRHFPPVAEENLVVAAAKLQLHTSDVVVDDDGSYIPFH